ncbi:unnamed protein product [Blepharisma stoltei]|uniref:Methyltransferase domain-containing protein n=1 Tax=Blepharisma stoltei TaxID=1481888 RepID=A0AAU9JWX5_9CILI|nr:unnamed protein product [Blepharisma stoltei]
MENYQATIDQIISFLTQYRFLIDSQLTATFIPDYFSEIPEEWINYLLSFDYHQLIQLPKILDQITLPSLHRFISDIISLSPNYPHYSDQFETSKFECYFMNPKKVHECKKLARFIFEKSINLGLDRIIDIGAGQGYLSHLLVTKGNLKVTAIEAKDHNSHQSEKRGKFIRRKMKKEEADYNTISLFVTPDNLINYTQDPCILTGLHTCGDLSATCIKAFLSDTNIKGMINVGCCYEHITEYINPCAQELVEKYLEHIGKSYTGRNLDESLNKSDEKAGFPLSNYIKITYPCFFLGRIAKKLAMSEVSLIENPEKTFKQLDFRAAFQVLLGEAYPEKSNVFCIGQGVKKYTDFRDFVSKSFLKIGLENPYRDDNLNEMYEIRFRDQEKKAAIIWSLRSLMGGLIENLILLDRAKYLSENSVNTEIFSIFDKTLSPRNLALYSWKN